ncbi:pantoate--beta-alanine ligase [Desulfobacula phenolica]|uniref:Pantothenate synthetase n=1 Tax=Desulfobacula phenolica TaxID=90732 RepID=A0A1H2K013_9BACT|nr:pantoate--beta-alanine ligase [Desulfobacula phenolica]SDU62047.1 pantoate--beta-alanine ligase [Desulfobacula phenolica]
MDILKTKSEMQEWSKNKKKESKTICFVPTMGYLHQGHISLMEKGAPLCDELVLSIFVNPTQFGPNEDLDSYPSNIENDLSLAKKAGATAVFLPNKENIYPENYQTEIRLKYLPDHLCGKFRPVHFAGVATVVTKLFNIVMPDMAVFGQKDYQQLQIIRQLTLDLDFDIKIIAGDIIREKDGLAMSSRNAYLSKSQRASALSLWQSLNLAKELIAKGEKDSGKIKHKMETFFKTFSQTTPEYICFCDPQTLDHVDSIENQILLALAVKIGKTRLIDNALIDPSR